MLGAFVALWLAVAASAQAGGDGLAFDSGVTAASAHGIPIRASMKRHLMMGVKVQQPEASVASAGGSGSGTAVAGASGASKGVAAGQCTSSACSSCPTPGACVNRGINALLNSGIPACCWVQNLQPGTGGPMGSCVEKDLRTDANNCGTCGNVCPAGQSCSSGVCAATCEAGNVFCSFASSASSSPACIPLAATCCTSSSYAWCAYESSVSSTPGHCYVTSTDICCNAGSNNDWCSNAGSASDTAGHCYDLNTDTCCSSSSEAWCDYESSFSSTPGHCYDPNTATCCSSSSETWCANQSSFSSTPGHCYDPNTATCCSSSSEAWCAYKSSFSSTPGHCYDTSTDTCCSAGSTYDWCDNKGSASDIAGHCYNAAPGGDTCCSSSFDLWCDYLGSASDVPGGHCYNPSSDTCCESSTEAWCDNKSSASNTAGNCYDTVADTCCDASTKAFCPYVSSVSSTPTCIVESTDTCCAADTQSWCAGSTAASFPSTGSCRASGAPTCCSASASPPQRYCPGSTSCQDDWTTGNTLRTYYTYSTSTVVISAVYGGGGAATGPVTYKYDFIELYNWGATAVSLNGWSVQYGSDTGLWTGKSDLPAGASVDPGDYYLIQVGTAGTAGSDLPVVANHTTTSFSMGNAAGKVALVRNTVLATCSSGACTRLEDTDIEDMVGYGGTANGFEGAARAPGLSKVTAAYRKGRGCTDTDDNGNDFEAQTPTGTTYAPRSKNSYTYGYP